MSVPQEQNIIEYRLSGGRTNTNKSSSLGGDMSEDAAAVIQSSAFLNLFDHVGKPDADAGANFYRCFYVNVKSLVEGLPSSKFWLDRDTLSDENAFAWSLDNVALQPAINQNTIFLDGSNDYIDLTNDATLWSQSLTKFSFSFWVYMQAAPVTNSRYVVDHGAVNPHWFGCFFNLATPVLAFFIRDSGSVDKFGIYTFGSTSDYVGKWKHVVCTYDNSLGSGNVKIYVDGVLGGTTGNLTEAINLSAALRLAINFSNFGINGNIKQFKWWTTIPLTQTDVTNLFNGNDSLVAIPNYNLPMDEGQGNPVDTISGTKVGTLTNGALWDNSIKTIRPSPHKYIYEPHKNFNGTSDFVSQAHSASLNATQFSISAWFRTSKADYTSEGMILNKGGHGSDSGGENSNYALYIDVDEKIAGFFETSAGVDNLVKSPLTYNDGKWHFALVTYDQVTLRLYIDGKEVASTATTSSPENNTKDLVIGRNSRDSTRFFEGDIDEPRVWNNDVTAKEQADLYTFGTIPQTANLVYENKFGDYNGSIIAQTIPDERTEPLLASWTNASQEPSSPNLYQLDLLKAVNNLYTSYIPIWSKFTVLANSNSSLENQGIHKLKGLLRRSNTDQGSGEGGSSPPPDVSNVIMAHASDTDCKNTTDDIFALARQNNMDHFLIAGDVSYDGVSCILNQFPNHAELIMAIGNHDTGRASTIRSYMGVSNNYFRKDIQNIAIIAMDSESSFSVGSAQHTAVIKHLQEAAADNNIDWIIVMIHRQFIGADSTHPVNEGNKANIYLPEFDTYKVDLVLQAHNHHIERTKLLKDNPNDHENPIIVTSGSTFTKGQGRVFVTNGTGGHDQGSSLYPLDSSPTFNQYQNDTENGIYIFSWTGTNNSTLTATFKNLSGDVLDTFTIS